MLCVFNKNAVRMCSRPQWLAVRARGGAWFDNPHSGVLLVTLPLRAPQISKATFVLVGRIRNE